MKLLKSQIANKVSRQLWIIACHATTDDVWDQVFNHLGEQIVEQVQDPVKEWICEIT